MQGTPVAPQPQGRASGYHHGTLRSALVEAGLELTRAGGPAALSLRAATRMAGVSPTAAYRHFADRRSLLVAVADAIHDRLAEAMAEREASLAAIDATAALRAVGLGYVELALTEPGWFEVAFFGAWAEQPSDPHRSPAFAALTNALDRLVDEGMLARSARADAEWVCWSAVHGLAELALHGPLRGDDRSRLDALAQRTVDAIIAGLVA